MPDKTKILKELQALRPGLGLRSFDLDAKQIPLLRELSGAGKASGEDLHDRLAEFLEEAMVDVNLADARSSGGR
ncbi:hypothetical protein [Kutzneria sp. NPDC051319]|uniref:hypothetical protein n=1 Tax=Kutzneria sp. NPDC051319 TaxID=3155047 RepID=UPI003413CD7E